MLSMPGSVMVLVSKDDLRGYRGTRVKRTVVTAVENVSSNDRYLDRTIIRPALGYSDWHYAYSESRYTDSIAIR